MPQIRGRSRILVRGGQQSFDPRGALSPKFAQNRGFSLKIACKLHDFGKLLGQGPEPLGPPDPASAYIQYFSLCIAERYDTYEDSDCPGDDVESDLYKTVEECELACK